MSRYSVRPPPSGGYQTSIPINPYSSSRSSYPTFLSLQDTLWLQMGFAAKGFVDAFRWDIVVKLVISDTEICSNVLKSLLLNSLALMSIYFLDLLILPLAEGQGQTRWLHRNVGLFYQALWLLPVLGASFYLNSSWCTLIAKRTYVLQYGNRAVVQQPSTYRGMLNSLASSAYRVVMVFTSVIVSFALGYVPLIGSGLAFGFMCWVDAYYCFEFIWMARGFSLARRVRYLEEHWAYFFAFGLPSAALCMWGSSLANAAVFALIFPAYIIMAMHPRPVPYDPYNPLPTNDPSVSEEIRHPSPLVPIRIPIFAPVMWLNDLIVNILSVGTGRRAVSEMRHQKLGDNVESVEEGDAVELDAMSPKAAYGKTRTRAAAAIRRKRD